MDKPDYYVAEGGLPPQSARHWQRAIFTTSYAYIPHTVMSDIVTSYLPFWEQTRLWVLARPLSGFAESFSHYLMDIAPGGGSNRPDDDKTAQHVLFVTGGQITLTYHGNAHILEPGGYAYLPAGIDWTLHNQGKSRASFHWIRKNYHAVDGIPLPEPFITSDQAVEPVAMPDTDGLWATSRFVEPDDLRHDMHVNIVTFQPGGVIPFSETHVMEHGLYVLEGQAKYLLNQDWVDVEAGDYMWLRAFCPQACEATGQTPFRYLLYKDVNRHMPLFFNHESRK
jgi:(S)-ureidoglycine aminohydrolase